MNRTKLRFLTSAFILLFVTVALAIFPGCSHGTRPYDPQSESLRDANKAQQLTRQAAAMIETKPERAEKLLREALGADLYHGPAHNNLGAIYLSQGKLYEAASEFEWASKLMPGNPDPRMNLALTLESAGRTDEALKGYQTALDVQPGHLATLQALTRLQVRAGKTDDHTREHLEAIAMRGDQTWRDWAVLTKTRLDRGAVNE